MLSALQLKFSDYPHFEDVTSPRLSDRSDVTRLSTDSITSLPPMFHPADTPDDQSHHNSSRSLKRSYSDYASVSPPPSSATNDAANSPKRYRYSSDAAHDGRVSLPPILSMLPEQQRYHHHPSVSSSSSRFSFDDGFDFNYPQLPQLSQRRQLVGTTSSSSYVRSSPISQPSPQQSYWTQQQQSQSAPTYTSVSEFSTPSYAPIDHHPPLREQVPSTSTFAPLLPALHASPAQSHSLPPLPKSPPLPSPSAPKNLPTASTSSHPHSQPHNTTTTTTTASPPKPPAATTTQPRRRGKLPKPVTEIMRHWILSHRDHPYPTEEEKKMLCSMTGLTMMQVSNWMINGRRRILSPEKLALLTSASGPTPTLPIQRKAPTQQQQQQQQLKRSPLPPQPQVPSLPSQYYGPPPSSQSLHRGGGGYYPTPPHPSYPTINAMPAYYTPHTQAGGGGGQGSAGLYLPSLGDEGRYTHPAHHQQHSSGYHYSGSGSGSGGSAGQ